jgi:hypothetical protein
MMQMYLVSVLIFLYLFVLFATHARSMTFPFGSDATTRFMLAIECDM